MARSRGLFDQLGNPSGLTGRIILWRLNRANRGMNRATVEALGLVANDRVMEIGFGGGALIAQILAQNECASVSGTDISQLAVRTAERRFRKEIGAGLLDLHRSDGRTLPFERGSFTKVCCVNVIYFWSDIAAVLAEIIRVLEVGGKFVICYNELSPDAVTKFPPGLVEAHLSNAGFAAITTSSGSDETNDKYHCTATRTQ